MFYIFGFSYVPGIRRFVAFNATTRRVLSHHMTELGAVAACKRYERTQKNRRAVNRLGDLSHSAI